MSNILLKISCLVTTAFVILSGYLSLSAACELKADRVLVKKSERRLYLLYDGQVIKEYPISLGLNPTGHKQQRETNGHRKVVTY